MTEHGNNPPEASHRVVEETELSQDRSAIIVNTLARQLAIGIKRVDPTKREFHPSACRRQTPPCIEVRTADQHFDHHTLRCNVPLRHLDR
jgi:hypothetical protein